MISRRGIVGVLSGLIAAPAIIKVADLMPIKPVRWSGIPEYVPLRPAVKLDVLYGHLKLGDTLTFAGEDLARRQFVVTKVGDDSRLSIDEITREVLRDFENSNKFLASVDQQYEDALAGARVGEALRIRMPVDFVVRPRAPEVTPVQAAALGAAALVASNPTVSRRFWGGSK